LDNVITSNITTINDYERQIRDITLPTENIQSKKIEVKNEGNVNEVMKAFSENREKLIHSYRVQRQEHGDENNKAGDVLAQDRKYNEAEKSYKLAQDAYTKASEILLNIEKIDPKNAYIPKEKKYLSDIMAKLQDKIQIVTEQQTKKIVVDNKTISESSNTNLVETTTESIIQQGDIYLEKYNTKFDIDSYKEAINHYTKAKLRLENELMIKPSDAMIANKLKIVNELIADINNVRYIEQEIVVWHQRTQSHNVFSMARFIFNVFNESYQDEVEKEFYGKYFKNPQVKERALNHAINVIKQISSPNGLTLDVDHIDSFETQVSPNLKK